MQLDRSLTYSWISYDEDTLNIKFQLNLNSDVKVEIKFQVNS